MTNSDIQVTQAQKDAVERLVQLIERFRVSVPAILYLESMRPLAFVGSQLMHVMAPVAGGLFPFGQWDEVARLLEDRRGIDYVLRAIEGKCQSANPTPQKTTIQETP